MKIKSGIFLASQEQEEEGLNPPSMSKAFTTCTYLGKICLKS